ncbi:MAG: nucleoside kinase [Oscillospiraceae bacterium]|nr:nucleoside kinase [Oscillospiraceae bacterium]
MPYPYSIETINKRAVADPRGFAQECEAIFNRKVDEVAASIAERSELSRVVFLSGPSGSGKTTTAKKICDALEGIGIHAHPIAMDKYYTSHDPQTAPRTDDGEIDLESPYCLDLELLVDHFTKLEQGIEVEIPHFDFKSQLRIPERAVSLKLHEGEVVIFEGIHALNDLLTSKHPNAFKLYISARSDIINKNDICFKRTWTRLMRRVVRDSFFRGTGALDTIRMWANVRRGEKEYISPFKYKADILFDSSMQYEVTVMKPYALDALRHIPEETDRSDELYGMLPELQEFEQIDSAIVPADSILREFIGGGSYEY